MKVTNRRNVKGVLLKQWELKEEHDDYFILESNDSLELLNYPKSTFDKQQEHEGASREGNTFYIPDALKRN